MFVLLRLYLPALIPSWRFFKEIGPSPRIDARMMGGEWRAYREEPLGFSLREAALRLVWNPEWTEHLYLVSCAERLLLDEDAAALREVQQRLTERVRPDGPMQFRLRLLYREGGEVANCVEYESPVWSADEL